MSGLVVSVLIGLSVMLYAILNIVPTSVLLGIFLYMGVSATAGIQLLERFALIFMPVKHHPNVPYVKKVCKTALCLIFGILFDRACHISHMRILGSQALSDTN